MKKLSILLVVLVMLFATTMSVYATDTYNHKELYSIELPDDYKYLEEYSTEDVPAFLKSDESANININFIENSDNTTFCNLSDDDLESYKKMLKTTISTQYAKQGEVSATVNILTTETKLLANGYTSLTTVVESKFQNSTLYQKTYQFAGVDYIYTVTITTQNRKQLVELDNVIETFKMTEAELIATPDASDDTTPEEDSSSIISIIVFAVLIIAIIIVVIVNNKKQKKKEQAQLTAPIQSIFDTHQSKQIQDELSNYNNYNNNNFQ